MKINYKTPYLYILSLCSLILILSLSNMINSKIALYYSFLGIIIFTIVWIIDLHYNDEIEKIQKGTHESYFGKDDIIEIHGERILLLKLLSIFSLLASVILAISLYYGYI